MEKDSQERLEENIAPFIFFFLKGRAGEALTLTVLSGERPLQMEQGD